jgi:hypothetical protein
VRKIIVLYSLLVIATFIISVPEASAQGKDLESILSQLLSDPKTSLIFLIQLGLGLGLGYFSMKALKYILAIAGIIFVGVLLNVWQFGGVEGLLERLGISEWSQLLPMFYSVVTALGLLTILPIGIGFFIGIIIAAVK